MVKTLLKSEQEWQQELTPEQFNICRKKGTERAFTGKYYDCKDKGTYLCSCCGKELFSSETKYDSGSGWPSFWEPMESSSIKTEADTSFGMHRVEVMCKECDAHLGHVFEDGPQPTGLRYCINSVSLKLKRD
jgi:peptide-methionine (R)-S-oxide reductase